MWFFSEKDPKFIQTKMVASLDDTSTAVQVIDSYASI